MPIVDPKTVEEVQQFGAGLFGAAVAAVLAWFKLRRVTAGDSKATAADDAASDVITILRKEVQRLSEQNTKLAEIVNLLQMQVIELQKENSALSADVMRIKNASQAY